MQIVVSLVKYLLLMFLVRCVLRRILVPRLVCQTFSRGTSITNTIYNGGTLSKILQ